MTARVEEVAKVQAGINALKKERNAIIMAHLYQPAEIQAIADFTGDSFALSQQAAATDADVIVFCGVHFMAESAKILSPGKTVLLPEETAGCAMADMVTVEDLREMKRKHPDAAVVAYVNSSAAVKAESDICCTSANAVKVVQSLTEYNKVIFVPDQNLGNYVSRFVDKEIIFWPGYCYVHHNLTAAAIAEQRRLRPGVEVLVHPECPPEVVISADKVFSTSGMLKYVRQSRQREFIIGTERGIYYQLQRDNPEKQFYFPDSSLNCATMKLTTLDKVLNALERMEPHVNVPAAIADQARRALDRMLAVGREEKN